MPVLKGQLGRGHSLSLHSTGATLGGQGAAGRVCQRKKEIFYCEINYWNNSTCGRAPLTGGLQAACPDRMLDRQDAG